MSISKLLKLANKFESKHSDDLGLGEGQQVLDFSRFPSEEEIKDEVISFFQEINQRYKDDPESFAIRTSDPTKAHPFEILHSKGFIGQNLWLNMIANRLFNRYYGPIHDESSAREYLKNLKSAIIDCIHNNIKLFDSVRGIAFLKLRSDI